MASLESLPTEDLKSFIALPVIYGDQVAVLAIATKERYQFPIKMQKILAESAQQIAWHLEPTTSDSSLASQPFLQEINSYCRVLKDDPVQKICFPLVRNLFFNLTHG